MVNYGVHLEKKKINLQNIRFGWHLITFKTRTRDFNIYITKNYKEKLKSCEKIVPLKL